MFSGCTMLPTGKTPSTPAVAWNVDTNLLHIVVMEMNSYVYETAILQN